MGTKVNNDTVMNANTKRIEALQKYVTNSKTEIPIGGQVLKPADVIAVFQEDSDNRKAVATSKASYSAAVAAREESTSKRQVADEALKGYVLNRFGANSTEAKEFGYAPRKRPEVTAETRANAVKLGKATRDARGTMGPKERLKVKGSLEAPGAAAQTGTAAAVAAPVPVAAPSAPAAAAANGAASSSNGASNGAAHS